MVNFCQIFLSAFLLVNPFVFNLTLPKQDIAKNTSNTKVVSETEAISLAEEFIVKNGYTQTPAIEKSKLTPELYDKLITFEQVMKLRHNSLKPKAYGLIKKRRTGQGWTIVFTRTPNKEFNPDNGRGVSMNLDGTNILMEPVEFPLNTVDKQLAAEEKSTKIEDNLEK
ncbi:MAG: hypothetical protein J0M03_01470 [Acidobacteria bacterium]|nr:hypothetical protein [Acidobacteriota bacterium]